MNSVSKHVNKHIDTRMLAQKCSTDSCMIHSLVTISLRLFLLSPYPEPVFLCREIWSLWKDNSKARLGIKEGGQDQHCCWGTTMLGEGGCSGQEKVGQGPGKAPEWLEWWFWVWRILFAYLMSKGPSLCLAKQMEPWLGFHSLLCSTESLDSIWQKPNSMP